VSEASGAAPRGRPPLLILVAISTLQPFALNVLAPATPGLARALATDYATIQLTLSLYLVAVALTQLIVGPISDRIGRRPCILAGAALFLLGSIMGAFADNVATLLLARVIQGAGGGTCFALSRAAVRDTADKNESASLIGYITMAMVVAPMIAPIIGGFLDARFGWRSVFVATAVLALGVGTAAALLLPETAPRGRAGSLGDVFGAWPALARDRSFLGYTTALACVTGAFFAFIAGAPYIVVEVMGHSPDVYGIYFAIVAGGYMIGNFLSGRFGRRLGSERLVAIGTAISLVSVTIALALALIEPWTPAALFLPLVFNAIGNGLTIPGATAAALSVRPELTGSAAGLAGAAQLGIGAAASVLIGHKVVVWPPLMVAAMLALVVLGGLAFQFARRQRNAAGD
jgi:DHA1 family bicyclomycin/chloramphenicol resistance-like MFS transporter